MLWVALRFQHLPQGTLEALGAWACQFTPSVSLEPPRELLLEVQGSVRLFGGLEALKKRLFSGLEEIGWSARLATAATARAALWFSRSSETTLHAVPVEAACGDADALSFLKSIGISTVGQLMRLPRAGLAQRCGAELLRDLDRALGTAPEPRVLFQPPPRFCAKLELPAPVAHAEGLAFAARRLLVQLEGLLAARQAGIRAFHLVLIDAEKETRVQAGLASPAREADRMTRLVHEKLSPMILARPVEAIRVEAGSFVPLHARTAGMFGDEAAEAEDWAQLAERLRSRLGHDAVFGLATHPDHRPEHAWRRVEPGEWDPHEYGAPGPRPLWLIEARKIKEGEFTALVGPERIESGWWDGDEARRDYFVARLPDGALAWVYREQQGRSSACWFLHGLFA